MTGIGERKPRVSAPGRIASGQQTCRQEAGTARRSPTSTAQADTAATNMSAGNRNGLAWNGHGKIIELAGD